MKLIVALFLCLSVVSAAPASRDRYRDMTSRIGYTGADAVAFGRNLDDLRKYDAPMMRRVDLTPAQVKETTTGDLLLHLIDKCRLGAYWSIYNRPNLGLYRAEHVSPSLYATCRRSDVGPAFVFAIRTLRHRTATSKVVTGQRSSQVSDLCVLALYPGLWNSLAGYERPILREVVPLMRAMKKTIAEQGEIYGVSLDQVKRLAVNLLTPLDPAVAQRLAKTGNQDEDVVWRDVEDFVKRMSNEENSKS